MEAPLVAERSIERSHLASLGHQHDQGTTRLDYFRAACDNLIRIVDVLQNIDAEYCLKRSARFPVILRILGIEMAHVHVGSPQKPVSQSVKVQRVLFRRYVSQATAHQPSGD